MMKNILVTGVAGFIGFHVVKKLAARTDLNITGIDNINDYYNINLKFGRLSECGIDKSKIEYGVYIPSEKYSYYTFSKVDISDNQALKSVFAKGNFDIVIHLAAQAGVRYSLENPASYVQSNLVGFGNILECCRKYAVKHLVYASSSSVYGQNNKIPFNEEDNVDYPVSFYAATKKSNELMAHSYSHLYNLPTTGLRFFTVYGPWGRPDMAPMIFAEAVSKGLPINVFNNGDMLRDFTYIDDITEVIARICEVIPSEKDKHPFYRIFNVGNSCPVNLLDFITTLEKYMDKSAVLNMMPMQRGDVKATYADTSELQKHINYKPSVSIESGVASFIDWYKNYYKTSNN